MFYPLTGRIKKRLKYVEIMKQMDEDWDWTYQLFVVSYYLLLYFVCLRRSFGVKDSLPEAVQSRVFLYAMTEHPRLKKIEIAVQNDRS